MKESILDSLKYLAERAEKHGIPDEVLPGERLACMDAVNRVLDADQREAMLFALLLAASGGGAVSTGFIAEKLKCNYIEFLKYADAFESLEKKKLIRSVSNDDPFSPTPRGQYQAFIVPAEVIKAICEGRKYVFDEYNDLSPEEFFEAADRLLVAVRNDEINFAMFIHELESLFAANREIAFVRNFPGKLDIDDWEDLALLPLMACALVVGNQERTSPMLITRFFGKRKGRSITKKLQTGEHSLIRMGYIEPCCDNGLADNSQYTFTAKGRDKLFSDVNLKKLKKYGGREIVSFRSIAAKELFYPEKTRAQIDELRLLLGKDNLRKIQKRLAEKKMTTGFCCLFSGYPGTGKTETAYQIARATGRDLFVVDASETKSMWFGESEKKIKRLFDRYRGLIKERGPTPILLFNEADAVLGKRQELGESRHGPGQTENAIQNIILQEMEDLKGGILVATTNMTTNFDKAFERRFLYKIEFEKPTAEIRASIWRSKMPELSEAQAAELARKWEFSGGQIENVARKEAVASILYGDFQYEKVLKHCEEESLDKDRGPVGFAV